MGPSKQRLIESVFAGSSEMAARMRAFDWSATALGPVEQWPQSLRIAVRIILGAGYPMHVSWGPDYTFLYNDAWRPIQGARHPAFGRSCREVWYEIWDDIGPMYEKVMTRGENAASLGDARFLLSRNSYIEECFFIFSFSPISDDMGNVGGLLGISLETTERVIEDRRRQVLRDLASRTAEARNEEEVWRISAETIGQNPSSIPFGFLYEYRPGERKAYLAAASVEVEDALHPEVIDCDSDSIWQFHNALAEDCLVVELDQQSSALPIPDWPVPPEKAAILPIRLREHSDAAGFLVAGTHPGHSFDDAYRQFVRRTAEQIAIGLASARAYEQERQRAEGLAELDRAKTTFFSNVSHEFRTPLTLILGPLEEVLPKASERLSPQHHELLVAARRNGLRLLKLVNTLLDFSRIEAGRVQASYQLTDLGGFTSEVASVFRSAMENAGLRFSVECHTIAEPVYVDREMWEKIVLNLISNAFKFTFAGEVAVALRSVDGAVELQVRDTGVGIPEEHRERIFERFHRIEGAHARTYEGTGIGLALVQELVKLHGGSVRVESAVGAGSTFTVTIPLGKEHLAAERIQSAQPLASTRIQAEAYTEEARQLLGNESGAMPDAVVLGEAASLAFLPEPVPAEYRERIILADDNADMRQYLARLLGDRYEVQAVADGRQALEATKRLRPALVLSDVMMPHLDGFGLLRAIREDPALASTPVILLSARAGEESRVEGLQADADDYLIKPFAARELLARVETHVKMANLRRETAEREERLRSEAEFEREKLRASEERLAETSRLYCELEDREVRIRQSESELRQILDFAPQHVYVLGADPGGTRLYANQSALDYFGLTFEEWQTYDLRKLFHPDDWEQTNSRTQTQVTDGLPHEVEIRLRRKDGKYRWFLSRRNPLRDELGRLTRWYTAATDIEDRKAAEQKLQEENVTLREEIDKASMFEEIVGTSAPLKKVLSRIAKVAPTDSSVLITGETGTGKELVARAIHLRSRRASNPFVNVNCAVIPRDLIASELFGHEKGAFTGATRRHLGRFELAEKGTIFLDEVGELPAETQVALLRVLQEREFERIGGAGTIRADVRVIAATNRDLESAIASGTFRSDLFYRLNVFPIELPPLRQRSEDIPLLVTYFLNRYARKAGRHFTALDKKSLDLLQSYAWPGNIRELQNVIERSVIVSETQTFSVDESWLSSRPSASDVDIQPSLFNRLPAQEKAAIEAALRECGGRVYGPSGAAARLGIPRTTLESKIKALKINKNRFRGPDALKDR
jgi:PAS domain S-box-containing protein